MSYDDNWQDDALETRKALVRKTIRPASIEELRQLAATLFPYANDPWADRLQAFFTEHSGDKFHLADLPNGAQVVYCRAAGKGFWCLPGTGMGLVQPRGLEALAEIVDAL